MERLEGHTLEIPGRRLILWLVLVNVGGRSLPEEFLSQLKVLLLGLG